MLTTQLARVQELDMLLSASVDAHSQFSDAHLGASNGMRSQTVTSKKGRGGRRPAPHAFTDQGVAMLSSVLRSPRAVRVNVEIVRAFVRLRALLATHADLSRKLSALEKKYDAQFRVVFDAIRALMAPPPKPRRTIGFRS